MEITLEKEFQLVKTMKVFNKVVEKLEQYAKDAGEIDIPEFSKMPEDKITAKADLYVTRLLNEGRLDEIYDEIVLCMEKTNPEGNSYS